MTSEKPDLERSDRDMSLALFPTCASSPSSPSLLSLTAAALLFSRISSLWALLRTGLRWHALFCSIKTVPELLSSHLPFENIWTAVTPEELSLLLYWQQTVSTTHCDLMYALYAAGINVRYICAARINSHLYQFVNIARCFCPHQECQAGCCLSLGGTPPHSIH